MKELLPQNLQEHCCARTASAASAEVSGSEGHTQTVTSRRTAYSSFCTIVVRRVIQNVQFGVESVKYRTVPGACVRAVGYGQDGSPSQDTGVL